MTDLSQRDVLSAITPVFVSEVKKADSDCIKTLSVDQLPLELLFPHQRFWFETLSLCARREQRCINISTEEPRQSWKLIICAVT